MWNPGGTGSPAAASRASDAPLPPTVARSADSSSKRSTYTLLTYLWSHATRGNQSANGSPSGDRSVILFGLSDFGERDSPDPSCPPCVSRRTPIGAFGVTEQVLAVLARLS